MNDEANDVVLEPTLTAHDKRILKLLPEFPRLVRGLTKWEVAELLDTEDVAGIRQTLDGLAHLRYVVCISRYDQPRRYYTDSRGVALLNGEDAPPMVMQSFDGLSAYDRADQE